MAYESKPGQGTLFLNDKRGNENAPDRRGYIIAHRDLREGDRIEIAGWMKKSKDGKTQFLSLKAQDPKASPAQTNGGGPSPMDDDIPFAPSK